MYLLLSGNPIIIKQKEIKICERGFMCRSVVFKCPQCCSKFACRGQSEPVLDLGQLQGHKNPQERLYPPLPATTNFDQVFSGNK